jgi:multicomponent Na+:H+ antiporter subunit E
VFRAVSLSVTLFVFWLLLSGHLERFLVAVGLACAVIVLEFSRRMGVIDDEGHPVHLGRGALRYWPWLLVEIVRSGWTVTRIILHPRLPIAPTLVRFRPGQKTEVGLATHANSITLTPGTISVEVTPGEFVVHALTREGAEGVLSGDMDRRVTRFEGRR